MGDIEEYHNYQRHSCAGPKAEFAVFFGCCVMKIKQTCVIYKVTMHVYFSCLQLLNKELREAKSAKMKTNVMPDTETSSLQSSPQNHLPQSLPDTAASAQKASSALPVAPSHSSPPASAKPHLGCLIPVA